VGRVIDLSCRVVGLLGGTQTGGLISSVTAPNAVRFLTFAGVAFLVGEL